MLSVTDVNLLRGSFDRLRPLGVSATHLFYDRLFDEAPQRRSIFGETIDTQAQKLWESLEFVFDTLDDPQNLDPALRKLGAHHAQFNLEQADYDLVSSILIDLVSGTLGQEWTEAHANVWRDLMAHVSKTMMDGAAETRHRVA